MLFAVKTLYFHIFVFINQVSCIYKKVYVILCYRFSVCCFYDKNPSNAPAATAEPITPATLGPMACISKKL